MNWSDEENANFILWISAELLPDDPLFVGEVTRQWVRYWHAMGARIL